jgi:hypothetical protein
MTKEQSDVRVADFNDLLNDAIGANTSGERIAARKALVEAYRNAIAPSASIADTAGAKPIGYASRKHLEQIDDRHPALIYPTAEDEWTVPVFAPPAPSVADAAGASEDARDAARDAARYRWLRQQRFEFNHSRITPVRPDKLDTMIDAAIAKESGK